MRIFKFLPFCTFIAFIEKMYPLRGQSNLKDGIQTDDDLSLQQSLDDMIKVKRTRLKTLHRFPVDKTTVMIYLTTIYKQYTNYEW